jgi:ATP-dependent helicase/nuclease subunit A
MNELTERTQLIGETTSKQMKAAQPDLSAWVSANAGSGKTHVLSQRVVRLLLNGTPPSAILCLTYTKAAAAEMSLRIFKILSDWTKMDDPTLQQALFKLEDQRPTEVTLSKARKLFASALETPGGLKIQTIHAFCESLLHRFPLEANVAGHFQVLDDIAARGFFDETRRLILTRAAKGEDQNLMQAIDVILDNGGETGLEGLLDQVISNRHALPEFLDYANSNSGVRQSLAEQLDITSDASEDDYIAQIWPIPLFSGERIEMYYSRALDGKNATPKKFAQCLMDAKNTVNPSRRLEILSEGFLTKAGTPRSVGNAASKDILEFMPDITEALEGVVEHIEHIGDLIKRKACLDVTEQALYVAKSFIDLFEGMKRRQAMLDYDDLIIQSANLFKKGGAGPWVHYKIDQGIDHILVDEAQDTSPNQWSVIQSLAGEFYTGLSSRETERTMFAVGDEKQSIYSFQGARPERFDKERRDTSKRAKDAAKNFESIALRVSFRSTLEVLDMVDLVFADADSKRGLSYTDDLISHQTVRQHAPGQVELWPAIIKPLKSDDEDWLAPYDAVSDIDPVTKLSQKIAQVLTKWIGVETILDHKTNELRKIKAGDILVLVRKRDAFVPKLMRTLKTTTNIPVAGADRLKLTDHIAIQDLIALGKTALLREDDLSLTALLKSPFFNLSEDQIYDLCIDRGEGICVWQSLEQSAAQDAFWHNILVRLMHFETLARRSSVHDFYSLMIGREGARQIFLNRLGHEVTDVLDEFLAAALDHDQNGMPGLQTFLANLESLKPEIKREQEHGVDAVRIMTVHASKGLEAPIVFLVDPGSAAFHSSHMSKLRMLDGKEHQDHLPKSPVWLPTSKFENSQTKAYKTAAENMAEEEYRRLLYVGLTRAADRLVVCGYRGSTNPTKPTWHMLVEQGFNRAEPEMICDVSYDLDDQNDEPWDIKRFIRPNIADQSLPVDKTLSQERTNYIRPVALDKPVPKTDKLPRPLVPSGASAIIDGEDQMAPKQSPFSSSKPSGASSLEYGKAVHRMLQVFPTISSSEWEKQGLNYLSRALPTLDADEQHNMITSIIAVLKDTDFAPIFTEESASEFSIMGTLDVKGQERIVSGRIDRMVILEDKILIVDYKTNFKAPDHISEIPQVYIRQLAIYRAVLQPLYPDKPIEAGLLYTRVPALFALKGELLDQAMENLSSK